MKKYLWVLFCGFALAGCKKSKTAPDVILPGTYSGKLIYVNGASALAMPVVFNISFQVASQPQTFTSVQGANYLPIGAGTYQIKGQDIVFANTDAFPGNTTVNTVAVLNGSYRYTTKGDSLILVKNDTGMNSLTYKLKKE